MWATYVWLRPDRVTSDRLTAGVVRLTAGVVRLTAGVVRLTALLGVAAPVWIGLGAGLRVLPVSRAPAASPLAHLQARGAGRGWSRLPVTARAALSAGLGAGDRSYWLRGSGFRNPAQGLRASIGDGRVEVRGPRDIHIVLSELTVGRATGSATAVPLGEPRAARNQASFAAPGLREALVNGPWGLEQTFTLARRPAGHGPLELSQRVTGDVRWRVDDRGQAVSFGSGAGALAYRDLLVTDARGRRVPAQLEGGAGRLSIAIDDRRAVYPLTADPTIQQTAVLTASDAAANDALGTSVAVSGSTIVVGAPDHTVGSNAKQGAVYVYTMPASGGWKNATQTAEFTISGGAATDELGSSVAIDGSTLVAGAPGANGGRGAVYEWTMPNSGGWAALTAPTTALTATGAAAKDALGTSVGVSVNTIVAGAPDRAVSSASDQGAVYEWTMPNSGGWAAASTDTVELTASDGAASDELGTSVAVSGETIVAGAPFHKVGTNTNQGQVYLWTMPTSGGWAAASTQTARLTAADGGISNLLGLSAGSVAVSGSTVVAGALLAGGGGRVYEWTMPSTGGWIDGPSTAELTAGSESPNDYVGSAVATNGSTILAGAPGSDDAVFVWNMPSSGGWASATQQTATLGGAAVGAQLGTSVGMDGSTIVAGAPGDNTGKGSAYEYTLSALQAPSITTAASTTFTVGTHGSFEIKATGSPGGPTLTISDGSAQLPAGVSFVDNGNGTATLSGTPPDGYAATYPFTITASNGVEPDATQSFTLTVVGGTPADVSAWGDNGTGQLAQGTTRGPDSCNGLVCADVPIGVSALGDKVTAVAAGSSHALALMSNGTVMSWGENYDGELGDGSTTASSRPVPVSGLSGVTAIAAGGEGGDTSIAGFSLALLSNGTLMAWGDDGVGELGIAQASAPDHCVGGEFCSKTPVAVPGVSGVTAIAAGGGQALALLRNGTVMAWGYNADGELGNGQQGPGICADITVTNIYCDTTPTLVPGLSGVRAISAGTELSLALLSNGTVESFGSNYLAQLGDGSSTGPHTCTYSNTGPQPCGLSPQAVIGISGATQISAGANQGLALLGNGSIVAWGDNAFGQLGTGSSTGPDQCTGANFACSATPVAVAGVSHAIAITGGYLFSLALLSNHTMVAWGDNGFGELGDGNASGIHACGCVDPAVPVAGLSGVTALAPESQADFSLVVHGVITPPSGSPPANTVLPAVSGAARSGGRLACSNGAWTNGPTGYAYQWALSGTPIQGATGSTYTVQSIDEGLSLTCSVTAYNGAGAGAAARSRAVPIPVPKVKGCPPATGSLAGLKIGQLKLGMTRAQARRAYRKSSTRGRKYEDFFCLTPRGVRDGYGSPKEKKKYRDRVIWISTSSAYYTVHGIRVTATIPNAEKVVKLSGPYVVGKNTWYFTSNGASNAIFKVRQHVIQEIGIAAKALTTGKKAQERFLTSFT